MARKKQEVCELNMTPMIDVVFQLIIFFVVTLTMSEAKNEDISLALGPNGPEIDTKDPMSSLSLVIEVDKKGNLSIGGMSIKPEQLRTMLQSRYNKYGTFPVMIRGDAKARHRHIRVAMDIVTSCGIGRVSFVAIKEQKEKK